jgi:hypothetical protein
MHTFCFISNCAWLDAWVRYHTQFSGQKQMLIVCMSRIKLSYIRPECKHRKPMSLLYRILLQKLTISIEMTKQRNGHHLVTDR